MASNRRCKDWLTAHLEYTRGAESPRIMHFWAGVSAIAACLRRRVWIDMVRFKWYPNFYIVFVGPPGVINKTTTMDLGMDLAKKVPGIKFGPDTVTWQALVTSFAGAHEEFLYNEEFIPMSAITLASGELGDLLNPQDRQMMTMYISLWDGRAGYEKVTKGNGSDVVSAPWINMIGCTTPHWIADNMPRAAVGGGFTSRCIFIYGDEKEFYNAYPDEGINKEEADRRAADLTADLEYISVNLVGAFTITEEARVWGRAWYEDLWKNRRDLADDQMEGYRARKQTHLHKLAMVLSVSEGDSLIIEKRHLVFADKMLGALEKELPKVFSRIGRSEDSLQAERLLNFIRQRGTVKYALALMHVQAYFPDFRDFEGVLKGLLNSGQVRLAYTNSSMTPENTVLVYVEQGGGKSPPAEPEAAPQ